MSDTRDIVERLRRESVWPHVRDDLHREAANEITRLRAQLEVAHAASEAAISKAQWQAVTNRELNEAQDEITRLRAEAANLRTVMVAAAEEIAAHWDAHCDAEGYGPVNLQRRLEEGIPSEYGYTAGAFAELKAERDRLRAALEKPPEALRNAAENAADVLDEARTYTSSESWSPSMTEECDRAIRMLRTALAAASPQAPTTKE